LLLVNPCLISLTASHDKMTRSVNQEETTLIKFVDDTSLKSVVTSFESEAAVQSNLDRLEE